MRYTGGNGAPSPTGFSNVFTQWLSYNGNGNACENGCIGIADSTSIRCAPNSTMSGQTIIEIYVE